MSKKVLIITRSCDPADIFESRGWDVSHAVTHQALCDAIRIHTQAPYDLVVFTGGADLNPKLYGEKPNGAVHWNDMRDELEVASYHAFVDKVPLAGICRGAQLLTVMNGGKLIQHKPGHTGDHPVRYITKHGEFTENLRECHHQCLLPEGEFTVLGVDARDDNIEIVLFPKKKQLAFQGHPEWGCETTEGLFFDLLEEHLGV